MKRLNIRNTTESIDRLNYLKKTWGLSYSEAVRRGLFLLEKELSNNESALELGKAYQDVLIRRRNEKL